MCGRVNVKTSLQGVLNAFSFARRGAGVEGMANEFPRWNGAPKQDYPIIIQEPDVAGPVFMRANWGADPAQDHRSEEAAAADQRAVLDSRDQWLL